MIEGLTKEQRKALKNQSRYENRCWSIAINLCTDGDTFLTRNTTIDNNNANIRRGTNKPACRHSRNAQRGTYRVDPARRCASCGQPTRAFAARKKEKSKEIEG